MYGNGIVLDFFHHKICIFCPKKHSFKQSNKTVARAYR